MDPTKKFEISVKAIKSDNRTIINILLPSDQPKATPLEMSHLLASGISVLIKSCSSVTGKKDYEILSEIIKHLEDDFASIDAFDDVVIDENLIDNKR